MDLFDPSQTTVKLAQCWNTFEAKYFWNTCNIFFFCRSCESVRALQKFCERLYWKEESSVMGYKSWAFWELIGRASWESGWSADHCRKFCLRILFFLQCQYCMSILFPLCVTIVDWNSKLCNDCDDAVHSVSPLHDRYGLVDGELKHLTPIQSVSCAGEISDNGMLGGSSNLDIY